MKFHVLYDEDAIFEEIDRMQLFNNPDEFTVRYCPSKTKQTYPPVNMDTPLVRMIHDKMRQLHCNVVPLVNERFLYCLETWDKEADVTKTRQTQTASALTWHDDDYGAIPHAVFTCIVYYHRGQYIGGGNLLIKDDAGNIKKIDTWSRRTIVIFEGRMEHCPEDIFLRNAPFGTLRTVDDISRRVVSFFCAKAEK